MFKLFLTTITFLLLTGVSYGQTIIKNPSGLAFTCPDHSLDDNHEVDIVRESDGTVVQTLLVGDPTADPTTGEVTVAVNVMPVTFGRYRFVVRAVAAGFTSNNSTPSDVWERAPQSPGKPKPTQ